MNRFNDVQRVLTKELRKPYKLGISDCFLTGLAVVDAVQETNHRSAYAGRYTSIREAHRVMKADGFKSLTELLESMLEPIAPAMAVIGDLGVVSLAVEGRKRRVEHVAVHDGRRFIVKTDAGVSQFPYTTAKSAFRV